MGDVSINKRALEELVDDYSAVSNFFVELSGFWLLAKVRLREFKMYHYHFCLTVLRVLFFLCKHKVAPVSIN